MKIILTNIPETFLCISIKISVALEAYLEQ